MPQLRRAGINLFYEEAAGPAHTSGTRVVLRPYFFAPSSSAMRRGQLIGGAPLPRHRATALSVEGPKTIRRKTMRDRIPF